MKKSALIFVSILLTILFSHGAMACTGIPDLDRSIISQTFQGLATLLNIPDGSGSPVTEARTADGTVVDATIHLTIITFCNGEEPVVGFPAEDMWLESIGGGMVPCLGGTIADYATDLDGHTQWSLPLMAGGWDEGNCRVMVSGMALGNPGGLTLNFNSPDIDGNRVVNLTDLVFFSQDFWGGYAFRSDLVRDGVINLSDVAVYAESVGKSCR